MYPFERFTDRAKKVLTLAQQEAEASGHTYIGTEHLLLGLVIEQEGLAAQALNAIGVDLERTRQALHDALAGAGPLEPVQQILPTSRVKRVVELSFEEARRLGHSYVGTEHMLFGLLIEGGGVAARMLQNLGVTMENARENVDRLVQAGYTEPTLPTRQATVAVSQMPLSPELDSLVTRARTEAAATGVRTVGLEHLLMAMNGAAATGAMERLLDLWRARARKEQAIAAQEYETASQLRAGERGAAEALQRAVAVWRDELV